MDFVTKTKRSKIMKSIKSKDTKPELILRKFLFAQGLRYKINYKKLPGKPDIVFFQSSIWTGAALCRKLKQENIPFMVSEHLKEFLIPNGFSAFNHRLIQQTYSLCFKVIATSKVLKKAITKKFKIDENKITLIPNPVDEDVFTLKPPLKNQASISITTVALFRQEKNIDLIIKAFYNILKSGINGNLNIIGNGPLESNIKKQIKSLKITNQVKLWGYLSNQRIVEILHQSDVFIMGSSIETFGVALIEAQACGVPAVATQCGGPNDIILEEKGVLVGLNSEEELTQGLKNIIIKLDSYDSSIIRKRTLERFGKSIYSDSIKELILLF